MFDERQLQSIWYGGREPPLPLRMLEAVYSGIVGLRRAVYGAGLLPRVRLRVPVVVVGNLTAGGTGKTPLTIALVEALRARGFNPGVISRGYGALARAPLAVDTRSDPALVGDEPCLIARTTGAPTAVCRDRVAAAQLLLKSGAVDVLIADDGLQHLKLRRDVEICVVDGERRLGNGRLLPAGPLRESASRLGDFDFRVCNGGNPLAGEIAMRLSGDDATSLTAPRITRKLSDFAGQSAHAVAGIGNPARFFDQLRAAGIDAIGHAFADHHAFAPSDLRFGDELPVLMTEKDAVKCAAFADSRCWCVPVRAVLSQGFFDAVAATLRAAATVPAA
jgi:tetraacyldisaccharide 4'-kinase